ncbi:hypothetical protein VSQ48_20140 [Candidatus Ventrimonas sp. KK005]
MVSEKNQKDLTTKQVIVPAKYFLQAVAGDKAVRYPVSLIVLSRRGGGASYLMNSAEELLSICHSKDVFECGVIHAGWKKKHIHMELKEDGRMVIHKGLLPEKRHMDTLEEKDVRELYDKLLMA